MKTNNELINALIKAQSEMEAVSKDAVNPVYNSGYATLNAVIEAVKKPLNNNGLYFHQETSFNESGCIVETAIYGHGGVIKSGQIFVPALKPNPHQFGSALTYARRYSLMTACGLGAEDDDANVANEVAKAQKTDAPTNATQRANF
mgnify:CR=1 FL=1